MRYVAIILILKSLVLSLYGLDYSKLKFSLLATDGKTYNENIFQNKQKKIFFFISPHCRFSTKFYKFIAGLTESYKNLYRFYLISPNYNQSLLPDDLAYSDIETGLEGMKTLSKRHAFQAPLIFDGEDQIITKALSIQTTPATVYLDEQNRIIYRGKIGDITPKGNVDTSYFEGIINGNHLNKTIITKVRGTEIKTKEDLPSTTRILRRYANETVKLVYADKEKIEFFMKFHNRKVALFFLWQVDDKLCRENLLKITDIYKIYRKRGLSLFTICISKEEEEILDNLKMAQTSGYNFKSDFYQVNQIYNLSGQNEKITPQLLAVNKEGLSQFKIQRDIEILDLRKKVLRLLD